VAIDRRGHKSPFAALIRFAGRPGKERTRQGCAP
jgi:hypothetical protein